MHNIAKIKRLKKIQKMEIQKWILWNYGMESGGFFLQATENIEKRK